MVYDLLSSEHRAGVRTKWKLFSDSVFLTASLKKMYELCIEMKINIFWREAGTASVHCKAFEFLFFLMQ